MGRRILHFVSHYDCIKCCVNYWWFHFLPKKSNKFEWIVSKSQIMLLTLSADSSSKNGTGVYP